MDPIEEFPRKSCWRIWRPTENSRGDGAPEFFADGMGFATENDARVAMRHFGLRAADGWRAMEYVWQQFVVTSIHYSDPSMMPQPEPLFTLYRPSPPPPVSS